MNSEIKEIIDQIDKGIVPKGYKETKLGIIPDSWELKKLSEVSNSYSGGTPSTTIREYYDGGNIPWIRSQDLNKKEIFSVNGYITEEGLKNSSAKEIKKGTLLIALYGATSGIPAISYIDATINQAVLAIEFKKGNKNFYYNYLLFNKDRIITNYVQGGQPNLSGRIIKALEIPTPSLNEQEKIADILSLWDKSIETTEKLIKEKEIQKKGLMQELLTGETRLPGFNGEWKMEKLGELGEFLRGKGIPKSEIKKEGVDCIIYGEIYTTYNFFTKQLHSKVDYDVAEESVDIEYGDLLFTSSGETSEDIGKCVMYLGTKRAVAGGDIIILRPKDIIKNKVYSYLLNSEVINKQKYKLGQGHSVVHLYSSHLKDINIPIIPLQEQKSISEILSTSDKGIELLKQLLSNKKQEKKGLMQLLLTGIVRV